MVKINKVEFEFSKTKTRIDILPIKMALLGIVEKDLLPENKYVELWKLIIDLHEKEILYFGKEMTKKEIEVYKRKIESLKEAIKKTEEIVKSSSKTDSGKSRMKKSKSKKRRLSKKRKSKKKK